MGRGAGHPGSGETTGRRSLQAATQTSRPTPWDLRPTQGTSPKRRQPVRRAQIGRRPSKVLWESQGFQGPQGPQDQQVPYLVCLPVVAPTRLVNVQPQSPGRAFCVSKLYNLSPFADLDRFREVSPDPQMFWASVDRLWLGCLSASPRSTDAFGVCRLLVVGWPLGFAQICRCLGRL